MLLRACELPGLAAVLDAATLAAAVEHGRGVPSVRGRVAHRPSLARRVAPPSELLARGHGDCAEIAASVAGELLAAGVPARAVAIHGPRVSHVVVSAGGRLFDPTEG